MCKSCPLNPKSQNVIENETFIFVCPVCVSTTLRPFFSHESKDKAESGEVMEKWLKKIYKVLKAEKLSKPKPVKYQEEASCAPPYALYWTTPW